MSAKRHDIEWKEFCVNNTPAIVKAKSRTIKIRDDWDSVKITVMFEVLRIKFSNPAMRNLLLDTGDQELVEGNNWGDEFWGVNNLTGVGRNFLGRILMIIRDEVRADVEENGLAF